MARRWQMMVRKKKADDGSQRQIMTTKWRWLKEEAADGEEIANHVTRKGLTMAQMLMSA